MTRSGFERKIYMNILLLTNCVVQPDDVDKSVNNIVFSFAKEWVNIGNRVIIVNNESKFMYLLYKVPSFIIKCLKKNGNFTVPSLDSRKKLEWTVEGVNIVRLPIFKLYPHASFLNNQYKTQFDKIIRYLKINSFVPDIILGHWLEPQLQLVNMLGEYYDTKKALVIHGELPENKLEKYKRLIKNLDVIFFRSKSVKNKMLKKYEGFLLSAEKTKVCYSGIPEEFVVNQSKRTDWKKEGIIHIIYAGRLERYKRIDSIIEAIKFSFPRLNFQFDIIGDGPEMEYLQTITKKLGLIKNVKFFGRIPRDEVIERMRCADCYVMISENEVFGLVYLEAMACGCVTVAAIDGGIDGIIINGKNGFLCKQGNSGDLEKVLKKINNLKKNELESIRNEAYITVSNYTDRKAAEDYLSNIIG